MTHSSNRNIRNTIRNIEAAAPTQIAIKIYVGFMTISNSSLFLSNIGKEEWQYIMTIQKDIQHIDILWKYIISLNAPDMIVFFIEGLSFNEYNNISEEMIHPKMQENMVVIKFLVSLISSVLIKGLNHVNNKNIIAASVIG